MFLAAELKLTKNMEKDTKETKLPSTKRYTKYVIASDSHGIYNLQLVDLYESS